MPQTILRAYTESILLIAVKGNKILVRRKFTAGNTVFIPLQTELRATKRFVRCGFAIQLLSQNATCPAAIAPRSNRPNKAYRPCRRPRRISRSRSALALLALRRLSQPDQVRGSALVLLAVRARRTAPKRLSGARPRALHCPRRLRLGQKESIFLTRAEAAIGRHVHIKPWPRPCDAGTACLTDCHNVPGLVDFFVGVYRRLRQSRQVASSTTGAFSSRNKLGNFSRKRSASCAAGIARMGTFPLWLSLCRSAPPRLSAGPGTAGLERQFCRDERRSKFPIGSGPITARDTIALSILPSCCSINASPISIRPPTIATIPGVMTVGSKV